MINGRKLIPYQGSYKPEAAHPGEWYDLKTVREEAIEQFQYKLIDLGIAMELPNGYEAIVASRSSTPNKWGIILANGIGVIDNKYCGKGDIWKFPAFALRDTVIPAGTRIAQFRILPVQPECVFMEGPLEDNSRGGIGSTGS